MELLLWKELNQNELNQEILNYFFLELYKIEKSLDKVTLKTISKLKSHWEEINQLESINKSKEEKIEENEIIHIPKIIFKPENKAEFIDEAKFTKENIEYSSKKIELALPKTSDEFANKGKERMIKSNLN